MGDRGVARGPGGPPYKAQRSSTWLLWIHQR